MKKNNAGMSIVELVVIIALMSIFLSFILFNASSIFGFKAKECYKNTMTAINQCKINTMSKGKKDGESYITITKESDNSYYVQETINGEAGDKTLLAKGRMTYLINGEGIPSDGYKIGFKRSDGSFIKIGSNNVVTSIAISAGAKNYSIKFYETTGKIE